MDEEIRRIIEGLTIEEKAALCSGRDFWHMKSIEKSGLPPVMVTDGPHGLRKQKQDADFSGGSYEATCFPTASCLASTWDRDLVREVGEALGEECLQEDVGILLGPAANIKRSPLCGRNFEYFSEDPFLTGEMAAAHIEGVQSKGIGTSLKHFAANNQEYNRMTIDTFVDERAFREIYLAGFEIAVKKARPWTLMCSYNKINGVHASDNRRLLTDILRNEWKFDGIVMSDWGAVFDRAEGIRAGLDLEMPGPSPENDKLIVEAVKSGKLDEAVLDQVVAGLIEVIMKYQKNRRADYSFNRDAHHELAVKAASEGAVLLKNEDGILPLNKNSRIALIGEFSEKPRYQGAGSSLVNPWRIDNAFEQGKINSSQASITYSRGYDVDSDQPDQALIDEACKAAKSAEIAVIMAGLPDAYESEGFDRSHMKMPPSHNELIKQVASANPNVVVVLSNGSPVEMPWLPDVKAVLEVYLAGQGGGSSLWRLLFGDCNPCGKLAESFPASLEDCPSTPYFPMGPTGVEYRESVYVGYRFYDKAGMRVSFPFGHGLSYTKFEYSGLKLSSEKINGSDDLVLTFKVKNTGNRPGKEIVQVYVQDLESTIFRPEKELKEFAKVQLEPGEEKEVRMVLNERAFAYYNVNMRDWRVEPGSFDILVGASSRDIRLSARVCVETTAAFDEALNDKRAELPGYYSPAQGWRIEKSEFEKLYGRPVIHRQPCRKGSYNPDSTLQEIRGVLSGRFVSWIISLMIGKMTKDLDAKTRDMVVNSVDGMPLRQMIVGSGGKFSKSMVDGFILIFNGKFFKGLSKVLSRK